MTRIGAIWRGALAKLRRSPPTRPFVSGLPAAEQARIEAHVRDLQARRAEWDRKVTACAEKQGVSQEEAAMMAPFGIVHEDGRFRLGERIFDSAGEAYTYGVRLERYRSEGGDG